MVIDRQTSGHNVTAGDNGQIGDQNVLEALDAAANSATFAGSDRLIGFLEYVVREELAGRGELIRAKTIAMDFYKYSSSEIEKRESVVRVDAGRLRRKLEEFYADEGADQNIRFQLPKGQYQPVFATVAADTPQTLKAPQENRTTHRVPVIWGLSGLAILLIILGVVFRPERVQPSATTAGSSSTDAQRKVLFDTSPERLQAINLAQQGRGIIFPATDLKRLIAAKLIFESVVQLDATYSGGHAGLAQVSGLMALIAGDPIQSATMLDAAISSSDKALLLEPDSSWAISAHAWTEFASGNHDTALTWSRRARALAPDDLNVLEFDALISLYSGEFGEVITLTSGLAEGPQEKRPFVFQNARSAALFHQGNYRQAVEGFEDAISSGAPLGPITVGYLMAAQHFLGQDRQASELANKYTQSWPEQRVDLLAAKLFRNPQDAAKLAQGMKGAGWSPKP